MLFYLRRTTGIPIQWPAAGSSWRSSCLAVLVWSSRAAARHRAALRAASHARARRARWRSSCRENGAARQRRHSKPGMRGGRCDASSGSALRDGTPVYSQASYDACSGISSRRRPTHGPCSGPSRQRRRSGPPRSMQQVNTPSGPSGGNSTRPPPQPVGRVCRSSGGARQRDVTCSDRKRSAPPPPSAPTACVGRWTAPLHEEGRDGLNSAARAATNRAMPRYKHAVSNSERRSSGRGALTR